MYGYSKKSGLNFEKTVTQTKEALQKEGFGIITEINMKNTLQKKIDAHIDDYIILGACHPSSAYKAIMAEQEIGLMLPCNVIVYHQEGETHVSAILPKKAMEMIQNPALMEVAEQIETKLKSAIDRMG